MCSVAFIVLLLLLEVNIPLNKITSFSICSFSQCMKIKHVAPLGDIIRNAWNIYENEKDTGPIMMSHLFLIIGLSYPVWLADNSTFNFNRKTIN
jgi:hypothetical protein